MTVSRYTRSSQLNFGKSYGSNKLARKIFLACETGTLSCEVVILSERQRLDQLAGDRYGDSSLWWIIAAANNTGRDSLVVKPGIQLRIPANTTNIINQYNDLNSTR